MDTKEDYDFIAAKKEYIAFCLENTEQSVFAQPWYLDAACNRPEDWQVILIKEKNRIIGCFPFQYTTTPKGYQVINNPFQTPRLGLWIDYGDRNSPSARQSLEHKVVVQLLELLPPFDIFQIACDHRMTNWSDFYEAGFQQTTQYSFVLRPYIDVATYFDTIGSKRKNDIRNGNKWFHRKEASFEEYFDFILSSYKQRNRMLSYTKSKFQKIAEAVLAHQSGTIYMSETEDHRPSAVAFLFSDRMRYYHMTASYDPTLPRGAEASLLYQAIVECVSSGRTFDFEGSMIPGVAAFNAEFNAEREPYFVLIKYSDRYQIRQHLSECKRLLTKKARRK